jgi:glucokinase
MHKLIFPQEMKLLGIDIGATSIKALLFDKKSIRSSFFKTPKNKAAFLKLIKEIFEDSGGKSLDKFGVGFPSALDPKSGKALDPVNLPFLKGFALKNFLQQLHKKAAFDNDVKCAMRAELAFGHAAKFKSSVLIAIGTGIAGAISIDGKIYYGRGSAAEIGGMVLERGRTFEKLAGGKFLKNYGKSEIAKVGYYTGVACANIIRVLDADAIILSGGVVAKNPAIAKIATKVMKKYVMAGRADTKILASELGELAGAIGAALI